MDHFQSMFRDITSASDKDIKRAVFAVYATKEAIWQMLKWLHNLISEGRQFGSHKQLEMYLTVIAKRICISLSLKEMGQDI